MLTLVCAFLSNFNIVSTVMVMQRMGIGPILCVCVLLLLLLLFLKKQTQTLSVNGPLMVKISIHFDILK